MKKALDCLLSILENPYAEKGYVDLKICYEKAGMNNEAAALEHLIQKKFDAADNLHSREEPRENNRRDT